MKANFNETFFDVTPDGDAWVVRCLSADYGRFRSQIQAFNAAVLVARRVKVTGMMVHVRVTREGENANGEYLSLL